jgi:hypothetical protein
MYGEWKESESRNESDDSSSADNLEPSVAEIKLMI